MNIYRIHRGRLRNHRGDPLYFLRHSLRDHDSYAPLLAVKQWCVDHAVDHHYEVRPIAGDTDHYYTALVLNRDADAVALRLKFDYVPGDSILFTKDDPLQKQTWTTP